MKKLHLFALGLFISVGASSYAQQAEAAPFTDGPENTENTNALFDFQFNYNLSSEIGTAGNAGVLFFNDEFWISAWASDLIHVLDNNGVYDDTFTIAGLTGVRSFTTDGTNVYAGTAGTKIYKIDPTTRTLDGNITISPSSGANARMVTYDPSLDGGNGGFWTGNFSSDIASFNMTGTELSVIPLALHNTAIYGGAVDLDSAGGPYLWIHDQGTAGGQSRVVQLQLPSGTPTGVAYDYNTSGQQPSGNTSIAGGLFISDEVVPGTVTVMGIGQGTPDDQLFGVELTTTVGVGENAISGFNLYPNPANGKVNIQTAVQGEKHVVVYDILGKQIINTVLSGNELNISSLKTGVYTVSVTQNKATVTKKLIVQ